MPSEINGPVVASFFGNRYVTLLDVEIRDIICKNHTCSRQEFIDTLCKRRYASDDITEELDRQCSCSTLRYSAADDTYTSVDIGITLWNDMCSRIHDQESMLGGQLQGSGSRVKIDIYRTDFQFSKLKKWIKSLGFYQAPVMRWTKKFTRTDAVRCFDHLMEAVPFTDVYGSGDQSCVLHMVGDVIDRKSKKTPWAWMVCHVVAQLELTPPRKQMLETICSLSNGPVDWKGNPVSLYEIKMNTDLSEEEITESLEYLQKKGIVRWVMGDLTPTGQGYVLVRHALRCDPAITFGITRIRDKEYQLEVSTPSYLNGEMRDLLSEYSGSSLSDLCTPAVFPHGERTEVLDVLDAVMEKLTAHVV